MYYLRVTGESFGFLTDEIHEIHDSDVEISLNDYSEFFTLQSSGMQFRLKKPQIGATSLFDYIEEFEPEQIIAQVQTVEEMQSELIALKNTISSLEKKMLTL